MGTGGCGGVGGDVRLRQPHGAVTDSVVPAFDVIADVSTASMKASPMVGNLSDIMPRSMQAPLLRKNVSEQSVIYVICLVENIWPFASSPDRLSKMAPNNLIPSLFAERILVLTGMRLEEVKPSLERRPTPAKQLWHPVSAIAVMLVQLAVYGVCDDPKASVANSALRGVADKVIVGWGLDLPFFHEFVRLSKIWLSMVMLIDDCHCPWLNCR